MCYVETCGVLLYADNINIVSCVIVIRKPKLLSRDDLVLPWQPLFTLVKEVFYSKHQQLGIVLYSRCVYMCTCTCVCVCCVVLCCVVLYCVVLCCFMLGSIAKWLECWPGN